MTKLKNNEHPNQYLQNAWNKYGGNNFKFEIIEEVPPVDQFRIEQEYLNSLKPFGENGYNILRSTFSDVVGTCVIKKTCQYCGSSFDTLNDRAIICDKCREEKKPVENERCYHYTICSHNKMCSSGAGSCNLFLACLNCKYAAFCDAITELLEADLCFIDTVSDGYLSPDDFWECN